MVRLEANIHHKYLPSGGFLRGSRVYWASRFFLSFLGSLSKQVGVADTQWCSHLYEADLFINTPSSA